jgi:signal transduction histidine kinase
MLQGMIKDYGPGNANADKEGIFERFKRRKKAGVKGIDLGLAIAKKIVDLHNGKIWMEDNIIEYRDDRERTHRKKQGSIFCVTILK